MHPKYNTPEDRYEYGRRLYAEGYADSACTCRASKDGWHDAAVEDARGRDAYLAEMFAAAEDGEAVDWRGVDDVMTFTYNRFGDLVR